MTEKYVVYGVLIIVVGIIILLSLPYAQHTLSVALGTLNKKTLTKKIVLNPFQTTSIEFNLTKGDVVYINIKMVNTNNRVLLTLKDPAGHYIIEGNNVPDGYKYSFEASESGTYEIMLTNVFNLLSPINVNVIASLYPYGALARDIISPMFSLIGFSLIIIGLIVILISFALRRKEGA